MNKKILMVLLITSIIFTIVGCNNNEEEISSLKIGVMPAVDSAPIFVAEEIGYFEQENLDMDIKVYTNAVNRESALQSGQLDGAMTDLIAFVNNINNDFKIKITTSTDGKFPFLVKKGFEEKETIDIGMMEVSVSNFLSEQYLSSKYEMNKIFIPEIPTRLEMIKSGKMDMAIIPEPMASMGELGGLEKRVYENKEEFTPEAMVFTYDAISEKEEAISKFHRAYNKGVKYIKENEKESRRILIDKLELNPEIIDNIDMPEYNMARLPSSEYMNKVIQWVEKVNGEKINIEYDDMVEGKFLD
ncbi:ABC transporter substrate-binding protein [Senegalia massiliensis]|uniref:ABC transporter substrate-binding protein n=1 Tax=Senegalia massiliensis TaxID=1720316 RepID=UPI00103197D2|nr:ABC transporter substrate-binding protein [Senegalia massiliensis]